MQLKEFVTQSGETLLYNGTPNLESLEQIANGPGDIWHSSLDQSLDNVFPELVYQTAVFWWFLNDLPHLDKSINWRINPDAFVIRKNVWLLFSGFPKDYDSDILSAFDLGYRMLRHGGAIPMYVKGLFPEEIKISKISVQDRYRFFKKNFKPQHAVYMLLKELNKNPLLELSHFQKAKKENLEQNIFPVLPARELNSLVSKPSVSVVIPTMFRQEYTLQLLKDYADQTLTVTQIVVVDATPLENRVEGIYNQDQFDFELIIKWQESKGSCRARNEAIALCTGDYIIFADDDTRILSSFVENHIRFLQTYNVEASNGLDISAPSHEDGLDKLQELYSKASKSQLKAGAAMSFSNANSCVSSALVKTLIGNDINFDGGYGEDTDFGLRLLKAGAILMQNPYSPILHLKPPTGGYRHWGLQASLLGKKRKKQAWELDHPVKFIRPIPSPTIVYGIIKHYSPKQVREYKSKYFFLYLFKGSKRGILLRILKFPYRALQFNKSLFYARNLVKRGVRY
ncbi:glycosyltransferase family 2 protein [Gillisia sp. CAL575]|uniref:glycosyltransferase family 2 protein n=1 Tax=Gillisia sp. CAL575 TaxID=985255 RepID=UPI0003A2ABD0|nr:glycosyltransferase [Gillisia sp. CAL575]